MLNTHKHYETAKRAYAWTSFNPEKRAERECAYFDEVCAEFAQSPEVVAKFERLFLLSLAAKSRCASSAITGPSRFPVEKQRRASEREHKISSEMLAYIDRVRKAIKQEAYYKEHPEARPVMSGDSDAIERLQAKLATLQANQEKMVLANKLIRKGDHAALQALLPAMPLEEILKPDCFGNVGFASFTLSNNRAAIKQVEGRIAEITNRKATTPKDIMINGVRCLENTEAMRLQLFFDGKPAQEIIKLLKSNGFKWSPSNVAWQRQLTNNAIYSFNHFVLPVLKGDVCSAA
jgi:hypothetical protein